MNQNCTVCGGIEFRNDKVLWSKLSQEWELNEQEIDYIDRQQGRCCTGCGSNLRSQVLALAIMKSVGYVGPFEEFVSSPSIRGLSVLEINEAGSLHPFLKMMPLHHFVAYPAHDMMCLDLPPCHFDLVIHSDTLEHVEDPLKGLEECCRVLKHGGLCIYTVPLIVGRMTRGRDRLEPSYHGVFDEVKNDFLVHTEFGSDAWTFPIRAGFKSVVTHVIDYPSGIALSALK